VRGGVGDKAPTSLLGVHNFSTSKNIGLFTSMNTGCIYIIKMGTGLLSNFITITFNNHLKNLCYQLLLFTILLLPIVVISLCTDTCHLLNNIKNSLRHILKRALNDLKIF